MTLRCCIVAVALVWAVGCDDYSTIGPSSLPDARRGSAFTNLLQFVPEGQPCGTRPVTPPADREVPVAGHC
jgi:hypothetical protein